MTDQQNPTDEPIYVASAVVADEGGIEAAGTIVMQGDAVILAARFADPAAAGAAYERLREAEMNEQLNIDGVLVADADADGKINIRKLTDHHTRRGTKWGIIGGAALAVIFPPSLIAGAVAGGAAGAILGKTGNIITKSKVADELAGVITPGTSGILAVVDLNAVEAVKAALPEAAEIKTVPVDAETATALTEAAQAAGDTSAG
jgi:uncharacterized membrane protein